MFIHISEFVQSKKMVSIKVINFVQSLMMMQLNTRQTEGRASVALVDHANTLYCTFLGCAHLPKGGVAMTFTYTSVPVPESQFWRDCGIKAA